MTVSKEALFERYKKLKAEGVSITLMELKKQMEAEEGEATSETPKPTGFSALSKPVISNSQEPKSQENNTSWTTSYSDKPVEQTQTPQVQPSQTNSYGNFVNTEVDKPSYSATVANYNANFSFDYGRRSVENVQTQSVTTNSTSVVQNEQVGQNFDKDLPKKFCLIGYPLGHSLSTYIHNAGFKSLGLSASYDILETPPDSLVDRIKYLKANNFSGFNVTIPLKLPITLFLDEVDESADIVGAVNTVVINPDKTMKGYNTDAIAFWKAIPNDFLLAGKVAGVLGTGGAARAAISALAQNQVKQIKIFTRNVPNSLELLNFLRGKFPRIEFNAFQIERIRDLSDIDILVNTTPIGMQGRGADYTPVEENELRTLPKGALVYDVIYNPKKTVLLKIAEKCGYRTINGVDMFVHQALVAEQIWTGKTPDFKDMKIAVLENL